MTTTVPFDPGSGRMPRAPLPGGRDHDRRAERQVRRQTARQLGTAGRMGLGPPWPSPWLEVEALPEPSDGAGHGRRRRTGRIVLVATLVAVVAALAVPRLATAVEPELVGRLDGGDVVRILGDAAGHRLDTGHVREVEIAADGTIWVAVGRRVLALGTPGAIEPRAPGWRAYPRRLSAQADGTIRAVEDGGEVVTLTANGWATAEHVRACAEDSPSLEAAALERLRAAGVDREPHVLASSTGPGGQRWVVVDVSASPNVRPADYRLLRFDGASWTVFGPDEGMPRDDRRPWTMAGPQAPAALAVDQDGRAWFSLDHRGLWRADDDGVTRLRFPGLGSGALDLASAPDGDGVVWIASSRGHLYRWSPEMDSTHAL